LSPKLTPNKTPFFIENHQEIKVKSHPNLHQFNKEISKQLSYEKVFLNLLGVLQNCDSSLIFLNFLDFVYFKELTFPLLASSLLGMFPFFF
jgi:hypothetical protein